MSRFKAICQAYGGISARELARLLGVSPNTICNIDNPNVNTSYVLIAKIADIFGVSTNYLLGIQEARLDQEKIIEEILKVQDKFFVKIKQLELEGKYSDRRNTCKM